MLSSVAVVCNHRILNRHNFSVFKDERKNTVAVAVGILIEVLLIVTAICRYNIIQRCVQRNAFPRGNGVIKKKKRCYSPCYSSCML